MKTLIFFLLLPLVSLGQTIHFEKKDIVYQGTVTIPNRSPKEVFDRLQEAVNTALDKTDFETAVHPVENKVVATGAIPLTTPFHIIRKVNFTLQVTANDGGYTYKIDSVSVTEKRRGGKMERKKAEELLEGMEETGAAASASEKLLNEIDMRFQKIIAVLKRQLRRE